MEGEHLLSDLDPERRVGDPKVSLASFTRERNTIPRPTLNLDPLFYLDIGLPRASSR